MGVGIAMWLGTTSTIRPMPWSWAAAASRRSAASPPISLLMRVWSTTSYPWVEPGAACRTGEQNTWPTPSRAR